MENQVKKFGTFEGKVALYVNKKGEIAIKEADSKLPQGVRVFDKAADCLKAALEASKKRNIPLHKYSFYAADGAKLGEEVPAGYVLCFRRCYYKPQVALIPAVKVTKRQEVEYL